MKHKTFFISVFLIVLTIAIAYFFYLLGPVQAESRIRQDFVVGAGSRFADIAFLLKRAGLIRSEGIFKFYSLISGSAHLLKPGRYSLSSSMSTQEIMSSLVKGPPHKEVLIVEGRTLSEVDQDLSRAGLIKSGELLNFDFYKLVGDYPFLSEKASLEGFLFPDTYFMAQDSSPEVIVRKFLGNFREKAETVFGDSFQRDFKAWYEDLIIASLIEKEIPFKEDRPLVAGILRKRYEAGMPLQVDATVIYAKCDGKFEGCPVLTKDDFRIKSKYNTYQKAGLPPTPIANAGLDAIISSRNPRDSEFWYYLSDPKSKKTIFSKDLEGHNENRARYLHI